MDVSDEQVRAALRCLYDGVALADTELADLLPPVASQADQASRAQRLRGLLLDAIEVLQPSRPAAFRSPATRSYQVLSLHYLDGLPMNHLAAELHISERQAYRDLARAEESLAALLRDHSWAEPDTLGAGAAPDVLADELQRIEAKATRVDIADLCRAATQTVTPLARELGTTIASGIPRDLPQVLGNEVLIRQTLVQLLSAAVRGAANGYIHLLALATTGSVQLTTSFVPRRALPDGEWFPDVRRLAEAQHLEWRVGLAPGALPNPLSAPLGTDGEVVSVSIGLRVERRRLVLIVEDNKGAAELYRRYLATADGWDSIEAPDPRLTFELAKATQPAAILLDILMPQQDGWSVLQVLRAQPETSAIPVVVCSVFDELELAASLGASAYLKKPVSQFQLLSALRRCLNE
ncbi:MAG: response regulator [Anaerolineae bacterium]